MENYGWTLEEVDGTDLTFLLDMVRVRAKKNHKTRGNADTLKNLL